MTPRYPDETADHSTLDEAPFQRFAC
jgi:hypothetical protein